MARSNRNSITLLLFLALAGCSSRQGATGESANQSNASGTPLSQKISSESVVKVAPEQVEITAGGSAEAVVKVTVQSGYHTNANPPTYPYLKPTELDLADTEDITVDYIYYPNPLIKKFQFADKPLRVYEGEIPLKVNLQATKTAAKGQRTLPAKLNIQACDDQVCYPPGTLEVAIPVLIK